VIPAHYAPLFTGKARRLASHRGYDPGALAMARDLSESAAAPLVYTDISRLLVDVNRKVTSRAVFSPFSAPLPLLQRESIIKNYYLPFRAMVESGIEDLLRKQGTLLHLSVHSFTPVMRGKRRNADIGILYDPSRPAEKAFAGAWKTTLVASQAAKKVRFNYPYRGVSDGMVSYFRAAYDSRCYIGIELEINQRLARQSEYLWERRRRLICDSFLAAIIS
jgi:predicted N-formylglutamate amidohydrolase